MNMSSEKDRKQVNPQKAVQMKLNELLDFIALKRPHDNRNSYKIKHIIVGSLTVSET